MKRYIYSQEKVGDLTYSEIVELLENIKINSLVLAGSIDDYRPRDRIVASTPINYGSMTRNQLLQLDEKELAKVTDIDALRRLKKEELTPMQSMNVYKANQEKFEVPIKTVKEILNKLKECRRYYLWNTTKNDSFANKIYRLGGDIELKDIKKIIQSLHVKDYTACTYSFLNDNWSNLLVIFEYKGSYTFGPAEENGNPVTVDNLKIYIKIDVDCDADVGYGIMSFHEPEGAMHHPYSDYPIDKE